MTDFSTFMKEYDTITGDLLADVGDSDASPRQQDDLDDEVERILAKPTVEPKAASPSPSPSPVVQPTAPPADPTPSLSSDSSQPFDISNTTFDDQAHELAMNVADDAVETDLNKLIEAYQPVKFIDRSAKNVDDVMASLYETEEILPTPVLTMVSSVLEKGPFAGCKVVYIGNVLPAYEMPTRELRIADITWLVYDSSKMPPSMKDVNDRFKGNVPCACFYDKRTKTAEFVAIPDETLQELFQFVSIDYAEKHINRLTVNNNINYIGAKTIQCLPVVVTRKKASNRARSKNAKSAAAAGEEDESKKKSGSSTGPKKEEISVAIPLIEREDYKRRMCMLRRQQVVANINKNMGIDGNNSDVENEFDPVDADEVGMLSASHAPEDPDLYNRASLSNIVADDNEDMIYDLKAIREVKDPELKLTLSQAAQSYAEAMKKKEAKQIAIRDAQGGFNMTGIETVLGAANRRMTSRLFGTDSWGKFCYNAMPTSASILEDGQLLVDSIGAKDQELLNSNTGGGFGSAVNEAVDAYITKHAGDVAALDYGFDWVKVKDEMKLNEQYGTKVKPNSKPATSPNRDVKKTQASGGEKKSSSSNNKPVLTADKKTTENTISKKMSTSRDFIASKSKSKAPPASDDEADDDVDVVDEEEQEKAIQKALKSGSKRSHSKVVDDDDEADANGIPEYYDNDNEEEEEEEASTTTTKKRSHSKKKETAVLNSKDIEAMDAAIAAATQKRDKFEKEFTKMKLAAVEAKKRLAEETKKVENAMETLHNMEEAKNKKAKDLADLEESLAKAKPNLEAAMAAVEEAVEARNIAGSKVGAKAVSASGVVNEIPDAKVAVDETRRKFINSEITSFIEELKKEHPDPSKALNQLKKLGDKRDKERFETLKIPLSKDDCNEDQLKARAKSVLLPAHNTKSEVLITGPQQNLFLLPANYVCVYNRHLMPITKKRVGKACNMFDLFSTYCMSPPEAPEKDGQPDRRFHALDMLDMFDEKKIQADPNKKRLFNDFKLRVANLYFKYLQLTTAAPAEEEEPEVKPTVKKQKVSPVKEEADNPFDL